MNPPDNTSNPTTNPDQTAALDTPPPNETINPVGEHIGPYRCIKRLGSGGMGAVYLAERQDDVLNMTVAVKLINGRHTGVMMLEHFNRERQILADLKHPHIAMLLDAGAWREQPYFIMEHIPGETIAKWHARCRPQLIALLRVFRKIVAAIGFAHSKGVIHRDIKPGNLMVTPEGEPKLLDFGIALFADLEDGLFDSGKMMMTPEYASPEQKHGHPITPAGDFYSLGVVLLELLLGKGPDRWLGSPLENVTELISTGRLIQSQDEPPSGSTQHYAATEKTLTRQNAGDTAPTEMVEGSRSTEVLPHLNEIDIMDMAPSIEEAISSGGSREPVPEALGHVLRTMLSLKPEHRYASAEDLIHDLDILIDGLPKDGKKLEKVYHALLWYHPSDEAIVQPLANFLLAENLNVCNGVREGREDQSQFHEIGLALDQSHTCLIFLGPQDHKPWKRDNDIRDRLAFRADNLRIIPVLLPGAVYPEKQSELPRFLRGKAWFPLKDASTEGRNDLLNEIMDRDGDHLPKEPTGLCPFRGLEVFREQDENLFFGREAPTQRILQHLTGGARFIAVLGPSGSGKSSLVQAGAAPNLRTAGFVPVMFTPNTKPLVELSFALMQLTREMGRPLTAGSLTQRLMWSCEGLHAVISELMEHTDTGTPCLIIDQFEEVFTLAQDGDQAKRFVDALCYALDRGDGKLAVVITMRSDFLGRCAGYPDLNQYVSDHFLQVEPMNREELRRAVERPVRLAGLKLGTGLLDRILDDVAQSDGELPLLEYALLELYERRRGALLTNEAYSETGGIEGALARRAEAEYDELDQESRHILRKMFTLCLVHPGEGAQDTRRRATRAELDAVGGDPQRVEDLLNRWIPARLLTASTNAARDQQMIDVAHEALIRKWDRIGSWMAEDRVTARLLNRLRGDARTWEAHGRDHDHLPRGAILLQLTDLQERESAHLGRLEQDYIEAGRQERERARKGRLRVRQLMAGLAVAGMLLAVISTTMYFKADRSEQRSRIAEQEALRERDNARKKTLEANYNLSLAFNEKAGAALDEGKPHEAWLLSLAALSMPIPPGETLPERMGRFLDPRMEKARNLLWVSPAAPASASTAVSPETSLLALAGEDRMIRLLDLETGRQHHVLGQAVYDIQDLAFDPHGTQLAAASERDAVYLWTLPEGDFQRLDDGHSGRVGAVAFKVKGNGLASGDDNGLILIRDQGLIQSHETGSAVVDLAFAPKAEVLYAALANGALLRFQPGGSQHSLRAADPVHKATGMVCNSAGMVVLGDAGGGLHFYDSQGQSMGTHHLKGPIQSLAADPITGAVIAATAADGLHILTGPNNSRRAPGPTRTLDAVSLAGDGMLNGCDPAGALIRQRLDNGEIAAYAGGLSAPVWSVAFTPNGEGLAGGAIDGRVILWDHTHGRDPVVFNAHNNRVSAIDFSPDGAHMASSSWDKTVRVHNLKKEEPSRVLRWERGINDVTFSPDGKNLAFGSDGGDVGIWDPHSDEPPYMIQVGKKRILSVAFSPNGRQLAASSWDRTVRVWNLPDGRLAHLFKGHTRRVSDLAFSPDGKTLVSAGWDQTLRLWDLERGTAGSVLQGHSGRVSHVSFSPDGATLLSVSIDDQRVLKWDLATGTSEQVIQGRLGGMYGVAFSADGARLASGSLDKTAKIWDLTQTYQPGILKGHEGRVAGVNFGPSGRRLASVSMDDRTVRIWDVSGKKPAMVLQGHGSGVSCAAFSQDGTQLISAGYDKTLRFWDLDTGRETGSLRGHTKVVWAVAFSPNGALLASGSADTTVRIWPLDQNDESAPRVLSGHSESVVGLNFSPDGRLIASASDDRTVRLWDLQGQYPVRVIAGHTAPVSAAAFSPDGATLATSSFDQTVRLWSLELHNPAGAVPQLIMRGHSDRIYSVTFSPDGRRLASSSADRTVRIWDAATGEAVAVLRGHEGAVNWFIDYSPDGSLLATPSDDQTVRLWRMDRMQKPSKDESARMRYHRLLQASLYQLGYRLDGIRLIAQPHIRLYGEDIKAEDPAFDHLDSMRPQDMNYQQWLLRESTEK